MAGRTRPAAPPPGPPARSWKRRVLFWLLRWGFIASVWLTLAAVVTVLWFARDLPRPELALDAVRRPSLTLEDRSGHVIATFGDLVGEPLRLQDFSPFLPEAVVAVEDRRFWHHAGIDPIGLLRAAWVNLTAGRVVQGGSTLTQQVAKTLFLTNARTTKRKVQELLLTLWLERHFSKQEILEIYLNRVYLGAGAWGMDAAAKTYFGVSARRVTLAQAAVLAGLPRAPSRFNPRANPAAARGAGEGGAGGDGRGWLDHRRTRRRRRRRRSCFRPAPGRPAGSPTGWRTSRRRWWRRTPTPCLRTTLDNHYQAIAESRMAALLDGPGAAANVGEGAVVILDARYRGGARHGRRAGFPLQPV